ncbi:MAG: 2,3-bisphosphoglycerate-independent phosphoglycerate mutase [Bacteroidia bacterium]|nr:2,3-bisphosphoglycerate-independent phosphoglycerate mutase [Bacteroidia bacterium]MCX7763769.1 2,3-bisphosphoglycerate-independent phosphoglycerate mutase [Bacteroidia bacterium]MDW8058036.1 2,3-bisphosphoglycerate-independent phosphoglycerate mutase [Bacteroidia bacterium]
MKKFSSKVFLLIWDGWGVAENPQLSAIDAAHTPFYDYVRKNYPFTTLEASGEAVGLPAGQMGNSEVGHLHIGAGYVVWQDILRIQRAIEDGSLRRSESFRELIAYLQKTGCALHLLGLVSDGGVHSSLEHLLGLVRLFGEEGVENPIYLHAFTDGRDTAPQSALGYLQSAEAALTRLKNGRLASVIGRYYAMDRDRRWERTKKAYALLLKGEGDSFSTVEEAVQTCYERGITDEFFPPMVIGEAVCIRPQDAVLFFNFRNDRPRQLVQALFTGAVPEGQTGRPAVPMPPELRPIPLYFVTMTEYDPLFTERGVRYLFGKAVVESPLGAVIAEAGLSQLRIAETEKYPHVTYFLNGGREEPFPGEQRVLIPSPKVATYDQKPEMSAYEVRDALLPIIEQGEIDFICLNFANPDMVGHTGVWEAAVHACEVVDECSAQLVEAALRKDYVVLLIADHGNADQMRYPDGSPHTAHTLARVPCALISREKLPYRLQPGILPQVAPTVLQLLGLQPPPSMLPSLLI